MSSNRQRLWILSILNEYGMIVVLIALMIVFSFMTIDRQQATGFSAGIEIANQVKEHSDAQTIILITPSNNLDVELAKGLQAGLENTSHRLIDIVHGSPRDARLALQQLQNDETAIDYIACTEKASRFDPVQQAGIPLLIPATYYWPDFLMPDNLIAIAQRITIIALIAIGMTMIIISGGIDLSVGSVIALSAVVTGVLIRDLGGGADASVWTMIGASLVGIFAGACAGFCNGFFVAAFRLPPFIVTLAMMLIVRGVANVISQQRTIHEIPPAFETLGKGDWFGIPICVLLMFALYFVAHLIMSQTVLGRHIYAVGGNEEAARLSGVRVKRVQLAVYTVCGLLAGVGGVILTSQLRSAKANYGQMDELTVIAAVVVGGASLMGGQGKILGTLIGAFIIGMIQNAMNIVHLDDKTQMIVLGSVIILSVLLDRIKKRQVGWSDLTTVFSR